MSMSSILLGKIALTVLVAAMAEVAQRRAKFPETPYALWASLLAILVLPALITVPLPEWLTIETERDVVTLWLAGPWGWLVLAAWLSGCGVVVWRQFWSLRLLDRLVRFAAVAPAATQRCAAIASALNLQRPPLVVTARGAFSPFLWHPIWSRARIVIPAELWERFSDESLSAVLRHELVHLQRRDAWRRRVEWLALAVWWWLPTAWLAWWRLRELEELCTDAAVVRTGGACARSYASALLDTEEFLSCETAYRVLTVPAFARRGALRGRIQRIMAAESRPAPRRAPIARYVSVGLLLALGVLSASAAPSRQTKASAASSADSVPVDDQHELPAREAVTVLNSDREIVLSWSGESSSDECHSIRLERISADGIVPRLWRIVPDENCQTAVDGESQREIKWIFAFLNRNSELIDREGMRHSHPGLMRLS